MPLVSIFLFSLFSFCFTLYRTKETQRSMESSRPFCWLLLAFLILSCFVAQTHGSMKEQSSLYRYKATLLKPNFGVNTSRFKAFEHGNIETNVYPQEGFKEKDRIERLPGQPPVNFSQYGGYITVNQSAGRALFYYFVEAQQPNDTLPLLLWVTGGPACSSLGIGAMQEVGPFRVRSDGKTLYTNQFSWNHAANVLFIESPAGVGFSYSNTSSDFDDEMGDIATTTDNYRFLVNWLERFPEYKNRAFYISGESYAGFYVPLLANAILHNNKKASKTIINLKGISLGNPTINFEAERQGSFEFASTHALSSDRDTSRVLKYCNFSLPNEKFSKACKEAWNAVIVDAFPTENTNILISPPIDCMHVNLTVPPKKVSILKLDYCETNYVAAYMNRRDVQEALHANVTKIPGKWDECSLGGYSDFKGSIPSVIKELMANGLQVWIYSGDTDMVVSVTSTKYTLRRMKLHVKTAWRAWFDKGEVGGFTEVYEGGLTFATVRAAGHMVPAFQPARALTLIKNFLDGTPLPDLNRSLIS